MAEQWDKKGVGGSLQGKGVYYISDILINFMGINLAWFRHKSVKIFPLALHVIRVATAQIFLSRSHRSQAFRGVQIISINSLTWQRLFPGNNMAVGFLSPVNSALERSTAKDYYIRSAVPWRAGCFPAPGCSWLQASNCGSWSADTTSAFDEIYTLWLQFVINWGMQLAGGRQFVAATPLAFISGAYTPI